jgi:hypothetical protein
MRNVTALEHPPYSPDLSPSDFILFLCLKWSERTMIFKCQGSHHKSGESADKGIEKWFPGLLPKALRTLAKVCHCQANYLKGNVM